MGLLILALILPVLSSLVLNVAGDAIGIARFLNYVPVYSSRETILYADPIKGQSADVDGAFRTQVSIIAFSKLNQAAKINIVCRVAPLNSKDSILTYQVCRKEIKPDATLDNESCQKVSNGQQVFGHFKVSLRPNELNLTIVAAPSGNKAKLTGSYSCLLSNQHGFARSNWFRIVDVLEKHTEIKSRNQDHCRPHNVKINEPIRPQSLPYFFDCCSKSVSLQSSTVQQPQYGSPFTWKACSNTGSITSTQCLNGEEGATSISLDSIGEHVILPNGTLVLLSFNGTTLTLPASINLVCYTQDTVGEEHNFYGGNGEAKMSAFTLDNGGEYEGHIRIISPQNQRIVFEPRTVVEPKLSYELVAVYKAPRTVNYEWKKNDRPLPLNFTFDRFRLYFPKNINGSLGGTYSLWLNGKSYFRFDVSIIAAPYFMNEKEIFDEKFVVHNDGIAIRYLVVPVRPEVRKRVYINGVEVPYDGSKKLSQLISERNMSQLRVLGSLPGQLVTLNGGSYAKSTQLRYQVGSLLNSGKRRDFNQSHTFTLAVEDAYGESHVNSIIRVMPQPDPQPYPRSSSCSRKTCSLSNITISCNFALQSYRQEGVQPFIFWYFNKKLIDLNMEQPIMNANQSVPWEFSFGPENRALLISNVSNSSAIEANVTCRFLLLHASAINLQRSPTDNFTGLGDLVIYDSEKDPALVKRQLTAYLFQDIADEFDLQYLYWIGIIGGIIVALGAIACKHGGRALMYSAVARDENLQNAPPSVNAAQPNAFSGQPLATSGYPTTTGQPATTLNLEQQPSPVYQSTTVA